MPPATHRTTEPPHRAEAALADQESSLYHGSEVSELLVATDQYVGNPVEPTTADWLGYVKCNECGRVYDHEGVAFSGPGKTLA